jgi:hypothetical protein
MVLLPPWQNGRSDENREFFRPLGYAPIFNPPGRPFPIVPDEEDAEGILGMYLKGTKEARMLEEERQIRQIPNIPGTIQIDSPRLAAQIIGAAIVTCLFAYAARP